MSSVFADKRSSHGYAQLQGEQLRTESMVAVDREEVIPVDGEIIQDGDEDPSQEEYEEDDHEEEVRQDPKFSASASEESHHDAAPDVDDPLPEESEDSIFENINGILKENMTRIEVKSYLEKMVAQCDITLTPDKYFMPKVRRDNYKFYLSNTITSFIYNGILFRTNSAHMFKYICRTLQSPFSLPRVAVADGGLQSNTLALISPTSEMNFSSRRHILRFW